VTSLTVWLLRHAETARPDVFHGAESDVGLSERGRRQAAALAEHFAALGPERVASSAMRRARATAEPIAAACGLGLQVEPALHERRVGGLRGTPSRDPSGPWPATLGRWLAGDTGYAPAGSESFDAIRDRVLPAWERLTAADGRLVVVAHGIVCRVLLLSILPGLSARDWTSLGPIPNGAVTELRRDAGAWHAVRLNEIPDRVRAVDPD
jgi:2,3-bisphosphoglycerate-dependent phosphoglycerate mutase